MTKRLTKQGCTVETTCTIQPNGTYTENITLSVEPGSKLSLAIEERSGRSVRDLGDPALSRVRRVEWHERKRT